jgi:SAM-dependent methyltransferase
MRPIIFSNEWWKSLGLRISNGSDRLFNKFSFWNPQQSPLQMKTFVDYLHNRPPVDFLEVGGGFLSAEDRKNKMAWLNIKQYVNLDILLHLKPDLIATTLHLPFKDMTFDAASCLVVLEYVEEPGNALRDIYRVLRPGGVLLTVTPFLWEFHPSPNDFFRYTHEGMISLMQKAGFREIQNDHQTYSGLFYMLSLMTFFSRPTKHLFLTTPLRFMLLALFTSLRPLDRRIGSLNHTAYSQLVMIAYKQ